MPLWAKDDNGESVIALTEHDLKLLKKIIDDARNLWKKFYVDEGSCVSGAGIAVLYRLSVSPAAGSACSYRDDSGF